MMIMISLSAALNLMMIMSSHPVAILAIILVQTINICLMIWVTTTTSWFSYILFLIFLGGLMVLFVYITSLASNEKFELQMTYSSMITATIAVTILMSMLTWHWFKNTNETQNKSIEMFLMMYSNTMFYPTILTMNYLLLTLIVAVKIASKFEGPLRNLLFKK